MENIAVKPSITILSFEDKEKIHQAALRVLSEVGMKIFHDEALALLKDAGSHIDDDHQVKIPNRLVQDAIDNAPSNISIYDRRGNPAMDLSLIHI